jgi:hypothetical protein
MKKAILYSLAGLALLIVFLLKSGIVYVAISPYFHYKLNETETRILDNALLKFREKVENGKPEEIETALANGRVSKNELIKEIKKTREEFGRPVSSEFFRSSPPERTAKYYENLDGTVYMIHYFTKTEEGEFFENITWNISADDEAQILNYDGTKIIEWQTKSRETERYISANYKNEIKIPLGERFIEIRY